MKLNVQTDRGPSSAILSLALATLLMTALIMKEQLVYQTPVRDVFVDVSKMALRLLLIVVSVDLQMSICTIKMGCYSSTPMCHY